MNVKASKEIDMIKTISRNFNFKKFSKNIQRSVEKSMDSFNDIFSRYNTLLNKDTLEEMFNEDALKINNEFEIGSINRESVEVLYADIYEQLNQVERTISDLEEQLGYSIQKLKDEGSQIINRKGIPVKDVVEGIRGNIDDTKKRLPKLKFGLLDIDVNSSEEKDTKNLNDFFNSYIGGVIILPEDKGKLKDIIPSKLGDTEEKIINNKIVITFNNRSEPQEEE